QASDEDRLAIADIVITNDATLTDLAAAVREAWQNRLLPYRDGLAGRVQERAMAGGLRPGHIERALARVRSAWEAVGAASALLVAHDDRAVVALLTIIVAPGLPPGASVSAEAEFIPARTGRGQYEPADPSSRLALQVVEERMY